MSSRIFFDKTANTSCLVCETPFYTYPSYIKDGRGKYCSKECGYSSLRKSPVGTKICTKCKEVKKLDCFHNNVAKFDGLSTECKPCIKRINHARHGGSRKKFIESKGSRCCRCGTEKDDYRFFDIDHIEPLFKTGDKRIQYDFNKQANLQVLCPNCHREKTMKDRKWAYYED